MYHLSAFSQCLDFPLEQNTIAEEQKQELKTWFLMSSLDPLQTFKISCMSLEEVLHFFLTFRSLEVLIY